MNIRAATIDEYLDQIDPDMLATTQQIIGIIRDNLPGSEEVVRWGIALFRHRGKEIAGIAPRKGFYSLYVPQENIVQRYSARLGKVNPGRGCIRFRQLGDLNIDELNNLLIEARDQA